ncbi:phosphinothricin acetyltransferase [Tamlana nanhaiensis]|uniref:Phosphinothricin acetyltransferase n=1 Tax=Neotamlana nanhaiensis TaxID=1382798 RepID=A0A0D7W6I6_9FLAO|nr:GNAT family N-acetyltransferase [Tamlana nanhaiensis]KJD33432.1 phosphinothricin acetyltransferase [Tamlana nanhaiensis]
MIRPFKAEDIPQILEIYNYYVLNSTATFDLEISTIDAFKDKLLGIQADFPFYVFEAENQILGYAYASKFRPRPAYNGTVESTVYVKHDAHGKQIGSLLYTKLIEQLKQKKYHTVLGVLTIPNASSIKLHEKFGFKQVAELQEVGFKFGEWQNVGFWQLKL